MSFGLHGQPVAKMVRKHEGSTNLRKYLLILILFLCQPDIAFAEPSKTIEYLTNDCVSLLDFGVYRMGLELNSYLERVSEKNPSMPRLYGSVEYDWNLNRMKMSSSIFLEPKTKTTNEVKEICKYAIGKLRRFCGISESGDRPIMKLGPGRYGKLITFFDHHGYIKREAPQDLSKELNNITELVVNVWYKSKKSKVDIGDQFMRCKTPLLGTEILFSE